MEGLGQLKTLMNSSEVETATYRLQTCSNNYATACHALKAHCWVTICETLNKRRCTEQADLERKLYIGSNLGLETGCPNSGISRLPSVPTGNCLDSISVKLPSITITTGNPQIISILNDTFQLGTVNFLPPRALTQEVRTTVRPVRKGLYILHWSTECLLRYIFKKVGEA
jgi:hypothetical protein